jgi:hypothetical protein
MKNRWRFRLRFAGLAVSLAVAACAAQEVKPVNPAISCERDELGVCMLPPLPPPTAEQLRKGREMLDKIIYVINEVSLSDEVAVMKVFGFTDLYAREYPTHKDVGPKGKRGGFTLPEDLIGTGFSFIHVLPWIKSPKLNSAARFSGSINADEACISIDDIRSAFISKAKKNQSILITDIHPTRRPPRLHEVGHLSFEDLQTSNSAHASAIFTFEYQLCAKGFGISYSKN